MILLRSFKRIERVYPINQPSKACLHGWRFISASDSVRGIALGHAFKCRYTVERKWVENKNPRCGANQSLAQHLFDNCAALTMLFCWSTNSSATNPSAGCEVNDETLKNDEPGH